MNGAVSAQKALQMSETGELMEERKRIVFPLQGVIDLPSRQINNILCTPNILLPSIATGWLSSIINFMNRLTFLFRVLLLTSYVPVDQQCDRIHPSPTPVIRHVSAATR